MFRDHFVPASAGGGAGGAETVAVTVLVALWPSAVSIRTVKVCVPGLRNVVTSQPPSSPYSYGALCSSHASLPSI
jgi:hypothetical protein